MISLASAKKNLVVAVVVAITSICLASITCGKCSISKEFSAEAMKEVSFNIAVGVFSASVFWFAFTWLPEQSRISKAKALEARRFTMFRENLIDLIDDALIGNNYEGMLEAIYEAGYSGVTPNEGALGKIFLNRNDLLGNIQASVGWANQGGSGEAILNELDVYFQEALSLALQIDGSDDHIHTILEKKRQIARFKRDSVFQASLGKHLGNEVYGILFRPDVALGDSRLHKSSPKVR